MAKANVDDLVRQVRALTCSEKLVIAAELVAQGKLEIAETIALLATEELAGKRLLKIGNPR